MNVRTPQDLGLLIRGRRRESGLSQQELARRLGVSRQWVVAVEKGRRGAEIGLVLGALNLLGVPLRAESEPTSKPRRGMASFPSVDIDAVIDAHRKRRDTKG